MMFECNFYQQEFSTQVKIPNVGSAVNDTFTAKQATMVYVLGLSMRVRGREAETRKQKHLYISILNNDHEVNAKKSEQDSVTRFWYHFRPRYWRPRLASLLPDAFARWAKYHYCWETR